MSPLVQELVAYAAVTTAAVWLTWRWSRRRRAAPGCDKCSAAGARPRGGVRPASLKVLR